MMVVVHQMVQKCIVFERKRSNAEMGWRLVASELEKDSDSELIKMV